MGEGYEAFYFDCKYGNEFNFFIPLVPFLKKVEDESVGFFLNKNAFPMK